MELIQAIVDFILHIDKHLLEIVTEYRNWTYLILFLIIFAETGLVIIPFLPGDSLLFAAGALCAQEQTGLNIVVLIVLLILAAILGDGINYRIGRLIGPKVFQRDYRFLNKEHLEKTHQFYEKHGGKTIIFARFIPIIRTFAPFVAGVGYMNRKRFTSYNIAGGVLWVLSFSLLGYFFGNLPIIKKNFTLVIFAIIFISVAPVFIELIRKKTGTKKA